MAASMEVIGTLSSKVGLYSRAVSKSCLKHFSRPCHVSVQEPVNSLSSTAVSQCCISSPTVGRSAKPLRNRLLSDARLSIPVSVTGRPHGLVRPYSVLPQRAIYTTPYLQLEESTDNFNNRKCWNCGRATDTLTELFFCHCGVVQSPANDMTFFTLFNINEGFDIDLKKLSNVYKDLQKHLHPDKFSQKSETEQTLAEQQSSLLNKAYFTLLKPLPRAVYLLELHGHIIEEGTTEMNPEFLMEVLDLNERIGESTLDDIQEIEADILGKIEENVKRLASAFGAKDYTSAKEITVRLKYYVNVESKVKTFYRNKM